MPRRAFWACLGALLAGSPLAAAPVPLATLVAKVDIPHEDFTLANGLRVIVHTDRKAPIVAVGVWYHVGSKDEPAGKTGFAHLFEHLMFGGSQHVPNFDEVAQAAGAANNNASTWFDRTEYHETVPTGAIETALFLESDRMGWLLPAMTQEKLDAQRGVVQNEKRQGDNQPYGLVEYAQLEALFPDGHPYHHSTIGSMADLDAASLDDVKQWFREKYGPNNAVLVLSGDIDAATARPRVEKYFGAIPRGPDAIPAAAVVSTLPAARVEAMKDHVATTRLYRNWVVPGLTSADLVKLDIAAGVLGGLSSSRLDNILVKGEKLAVSVSASVQPFERVSLFEVTADVKPGIDPAKVAARLDSIVAGFLKAGPTADEVQRVAMREVTGRIDALESSGDNANTLGEAMLYGGDADFYKRQLAQYAAATPAAVSATARMWLSRPAYQLTVTPGDRSPYDEAKAVQASGAARGPSYFREPGVDSAPAPGGLDRSRLPTIGDIKDLDFPAVQHATLANGIKLSYVQRTGMPLTRLSLSFDAGNAADPKDKLGLQAFTLALLDEGTRRRTSIQIAEEQERLGAAIGAKASMDRTVIGLSALTPNLAASLDLFADIVRNPSFDPVEIERVRSQQLAGIEAELNDPRAIAMRALPPLLYGKAHPYGVPFTGTGDPLVVKTVTRADMIAFQQAWLRPDNAELFVVSDAPLAEIVAKLDAALGDWKPVGTRQLKQVASPIPPASGRIILIDRPDSPQSMIVGGEVLGLEGNQEILDLLSANEVLGASFLSRLNMDLRETRAWSYGVGSSVNRMVGRMPWMLHAPVQTDKTGASIQALVADIDDFLSSKGVTPEELDRTTTGSIRELPGSFETSTDVLTAMQTNSLFGRPDDYYTHLAARYRALTAADLDKAARATFDPGKMLWVVVGDAAKVRPQLDVLGLPIEVMTAR